MTVLQFSIKNVINVFYNDKNCVILNSALRRKPRNCDVFGPKSELVNSKYRMYVCSYMLHFCCVL